MASCASWALPRDRYVGGASGTYSAPMRAIDPAAGLGLRLARHPDRVGPHVGDEADRRPRDPSSMPS